MENPEVNNHDLDHNEDYNEHKEVLSLDNCDFNNHQNKLNSPRSIEALKRIGVEPRELYLT